MNQKTIKELSNSELVSWKAKLDQELRLRDIDLRDREITRQYAENGITDILWWCKENVGREGLKETPKRYIKFLEEFLNPPEFEFTTFQNDGMDEMVLVSNIPFFSMCEHHTLPFFGIGAIAYIPTDKIVGLSKLPRVLDMFSRRFQNQERITKQVAEYIEENLKPKGVGVVLKARHMCVEMRGVKKHDCWTTTNFLTGVFKNDASCRNEFLNSIKNI